MGFMGWPGLPSALESLLWECGKGETRWGCLHALGWPEVRQGKG